MTELSQPEISIEELKSSIRQAVARREAEGRTAFIRASAELFDLLSADLPAGDFSVADPSVSSGLALKHSEVAPLKLQSEFVPRSDDHYHVNDLLKYHDHEFVWNAYRALLKREPDEEGLRSYLRQLRSGRFNKIDVLASLRFSPEGRRNKVSIDGLRSPAMIRSLYRLPVIGYLIEFAVGLARLPSLIRHQRQIETHLIAQQQRIADHINTAHQTLSDGLDATNRNLGRVHEQLRESFSQAFSDLAAEQKRIAHLQHQQVAALFRVQQKAAIERSSINGKEGDLIAEGRLTRQGRTARGNDNQLELDELYASFQNQFRGDPEEVKENLKVYLPLLQESGITGDILDVGCGRGEWLELLRDEGLQGRGVETNQAMIAHGRTRQLEMIEANAVVYLRSLPENGLQAVTAFHFVEHIGLEYLIALLEEILRTLKPGGLLILETPNPKNLVVGACNFYSDPTHHKPLFPESLQFLVEHIGFERTRLQYLHPVEGSPFTNGDEASQALNTWFFGARDYALIAWKA